jgi:hypothetical protein
MKKSIIFLVLLLSGCQSTQTSKPSHFLDGVIPDIGKYGYSDQTGIDYWGIHNTAYSKNERFGLLYLNWASLGPGKRLMWITTAPNGGKYCNYKDVHSGHAALKINGEWVKSDASCIANRVLSFEPENTFTVKDLNVSVAVVFDYDGEIASVYELDVTFDNSGAINAMKYVYDKSIVNYKNKSTL